MGGDYSRMSFKPSRDYTGVLRQQGRVGLEADHNELVEISDRRWRAESIDIMGRTVVPISDLENITAFQILPSGPNDFTIGRGRMYVDGLLIECRGAAPIEYDESLGEERGTQPLPSTQQPYYPNAPAPPGSGGGLTDLVYVDAWEREVTAVQDPEIREIALGGPDTATRVQTVWQVRVLPNVGVLNCSDDIAAWTQLIASSTGRLTSQAVQPPASDDPCVLSPTGGYRGLENRLYRVEIHDGTQLGAARFKWSRDNGSIVTEVESIQGGTQLTVRRIGRDANLRFRVGDWVEVTDDPTEFDLKSGHMAQVTNIDDAHRVVTIAPAVPATFDAAKAANHTRLRRWDQSVGVDVDGLLTVVAGPIAIEDGIEILFSGVGDAFKAGDYWVFAARTADGSVEPLQTAPPRGVLHHYSRLALITWVNPPVMSDCRNFWPAEGCCTEVVWPGESIQAAIDRLPMTGGCVCLKAGVHTIKTELTIALSNVTMHGESIGAVVRGDVKFMLVIDAENVTVHDIRFEIVGQGAQAIIVARDALDASVHDCELIARVDLDPATSVTGIMAIGETTATIERNEIGDVMVGVWATRTDRVDVIGNRMAGRLVRGSAGGGLPSGLVGIVADILEACRIEDNALDGFWVGAYVGTGSRQSVLIRNRITRGGTANMAPNPSVVAGLIPTLNQKIELFAIECAAAGAVIAGNFMNVANEGQGGIHVTAPQVRIEENQIECGLKDWVDPSPRGIFLDSATNNASISWSIVRANALNGPQTGIDVAAGSAVGAEHIQILDNLYRGARVPTAFFGAFGVRAPLLRDSRIARNEIADVPVGIELGLRTTMSGNVVSGNTLSDVNVGCLAIAQSEFTVSDNVISRVALVAVLTSRAARAHLTSNSIADSLFGIFTLDGVSVTLRANVITDGAEGIAALRETDLVIDGNRLEDIATNAILTSSAVGLAVRHNHVGRCAHDILPGGVQFAAAIFNLLSFTSATVESCDVLATGLQATGKMTLATTYAILELGVANAHIRGNRIDNPVILADPRHFGIMLAVGARAELTDNVVTGAGLQSLIAVRAFVLPFSDVICSGNRCVQTVPKPQNPVSASIEIVANRLTAVGNQVRASRPDYRSFNTVGTVRISASGNVTSGPWPLGVSNFLPVLATANHIQVP